MLGTEYGGVTPQTDTKLRAAGQRVLGHQRVWTVRQLLVGHRTVGQTVVGRTYLVDLVSHRDRIGWHRVDGGKHRIVQGRVGVTEVTGHVMGRLRGCEGTFWKINKKSNHEQKHACVFKCMLHNYNNHNGNQGHAIFELISNSQNSVNLKSTTHIVLNYIKQQLFCKYFSIFRVCIKYGDVTQYIYENKHCNKIQNVNSILMLLLTATIA